MRGWTVVRALPEATIRGRAKARAAVLKTRADVMGAIAALTAYEFAALRLDAIQRERSLLDASTSQRIADLTTRIATAEQAIDHVEASGLPHPEALATAEAARSDLHRMKSELNAQVDERVARLGELNDRYELADRARGDAAKLLHEAQALLGTEKLVLEDLIHMTGHPDAADLVTCISRPRRAARAAMLHDVMKIEAQHAEQQLLQVGLSYEYDQALSDLIDAESNHLDARRSRDAAERNLEFRLRLLLRATRSLTAATPAAMATPDNPVAPALGSGRAGSESGAQPAAPDTQGPGSPGTVNGAVRDSRSEHRSSGPEVSAPEVASS